MVRIGNQSQGGARNDLLPKCGLEGPQNKRTSVSLIYYHSYEYIKKIIYLVTIISWVIFTVLGALRQCVLVKIKDGQALKLLKKNFCW